MHGGAHERNTEKTSLEESSIVMTEFCKPDWSNKKYFFLQL
jgi:hypothetical protein